MSPTVRRSRVNVQRCGRQTIIATPPREGVGHPTDRELMIRKQF